MVRRSKNWIIKPFKHYYFVQVGYPIKIKKLDLGWKDKYALPRYEWSPAFYIYFFKWQFCIWWNAPDKNNDLYYEMILWWNCYKNKNINIAKETWGWQSKGISTWNDNYLKDKDNI